MERKPRAAPEVYASGRWYTKQCRQAMPSAMTLRGEFFWYYNSFLREILPTAVKSGNSPLSKFH